MDTVGPAVRSVGAAVAGLPNDFLRLDHFDDARLPGVGHRIQNVNPRRPHAGHHKVAPLHMRVRRVRAQARAARVPSEVVQLVAGAGHVHARDLGAAAGRVGIDMQHSKRVAAARIRVEQRHIGERFDRGCMAMVGDG